MREVYNHEDEIDVYWDPDPGATTDNFRGCAVFLEDPDISSAAEAPMDGSVPLDGSSQTSGQWQPERKSDSFNSPAVIKVPAQDADRNVRVYLAAFGPQSNFTLNRANEASPTPNIKILVPARSQAYGSGQEYAWNVTNVSVVQIDDFDNAAGPKYTLVFDYDKPDPSIPLPPGMGPFGGIEILYTYGDITTPTDSGVFLPVDEPGPWTSPAYDAVATGTFTVWFVSRNVDGQQNSIVPGVTPSVDVTVVYPPEGEASAPDVSDFRLTNARMQWTANGTTWSLIDADWTVPDSPRYAGMNIYRIDPLPIVSYFQQPTPVAHRTLEEKNWPSTPQLWTLAAISYDFNGQPAADPNTLPLPDHIPTAVWHIGPPGPGSTGGEFTGQIGIAGTTIDIEQQVSDDGVPMMRAVIKNWQNPTDNSFGGASIARVEDNDLTNPIWFDAQKSDTSLTTPWEPAPESTLFDFYFVARDLQNNRNSILPGFTPVIHINFVPMPGDIKASRLPNDWFDPTEFQWPAYPGGYFQALQFIAKKIFVGSILRVGGGTGTADATFGGQENGQIAVYNSSNVLRAWMGQQDNATPDNPATHSIFGGWFAELYVGGDGPPTAPLYAKQDGTVIVGGFDIQPGPRYPYISIRRNDNTEIGRIGARIGANLVPTTDPAYIAGAWFQEFACGGSSLANWRILARRDQTNSAGGDLFNLRNINRFTIDYIANYPSSTNPFNDQYHFEMGYDAFVADVANSNYYKFPGLSLYRTGTTHGCNLINRGLVLISPTGTRLGAFVSFNGDQFGNNIPSWFWGVLTLNNPNSGTPTITLSSGSAGNVANPSIFMTDQSGTQTYFGADTVNAVVCRLGVSTNAGLVIDSGNNIHGSTYFSGAGGSIVINTSAQFVGTGGVNTSGAVTCSGNMTTGAQMQCQGIVVAGTPRCGTDGIWHGGLQFNDHCYAQDFGIYGVAVGQTENILVSTPTGSTTLKFQGGIYIGRF